MTSLSRKINDVTSNMKATQIICAAQMDRSHLQEEQSTQLWEMKRTPTPLRKAGTEIAQCEVSVNMHRAF